jgi:hypothetical protein
MSVLVKFLPTTSRFLFRRVLLLDCFATSYKIALQKIGFFNKFGQIKKYYCKGSKLP